MSVEMVHSCPFCPTGENAANRDAIATPFGTITLYGLDAVMDSSGFARNTINAINAITGQNDQPNLSAYGLTTVFSCVGGALALHNGWHESHLMKRIDDVVGRVISNFKWVRGGLQTVAGALFVPVRGLSMAAYITSSKSLEQVAGVLGQIGCSLFAVIGLLMSVNVALEIHAQVTLRQELNAVYANDPALDTAARSRACLEFLQQKLAISDVEQAEILHTVSTDQTLVTDEARAAKIQELRTILSERKCSILKRAIGENNVTAIQTASLVEAENLVSGIFADNEKMLIKSAFTLALSLLGLAGGILSLVATGQVALIVAASMNAASAAAWFGFDIYQLIKALENSAPQKYDNFLLASVSLGCILAVSLSAMLEEGIAMHAVTVSLGLLWLLINLTCFIRSNFLVEDAVSEMELSTHTQALEA